MNEEINISQAINGLYPDLIPNKDFIVQDDGEGPYLKEWRNNAPKPTETQINEGWSNYKDIKKTVQAIDFTVKKNKEYINEIKKILKVKSDEIDRDEMIEFAAALIEYQEIKSLKISRYPLFAARIQDWTNQELLPNLSEL